MCLCVHACLCVINVFFPFLFMGSCRLRWMRIWALNIEPQYIFHKSILTLHMWDITFLIPPVSHSLFFFYFLYFSSFFCWHLTYTSERKKNNIINGLGALVRLELFIRRTIIRPTPVIIFRPVRSYVYSFNKQIQSFILQWPWHVLGGEDVAEGKI